MATIADLIGSPTTLVQPGAVFLGPMDGVDHNKFFIIAGISGNRILACSVLINSTINPFIMRRPHLLELQVMIRPDEYSFLSHDSFINCSNPITGQLIHFDDPKFQFKGQLTENHTQEVQQKIIESGVLTTEEVATFFNK